MTRPRHSGVALKCGHPNTRANLMATKYNGEICRECNREHNRRYRQRQKAPLSPTALSLEFAAPEVNDAIALFRLEKARRAERPNPLMDAARRELAAQLERARVGQGRPKGSKNGCRQDISDLMTRREA